MAALNVQTQLVLHHRRTIHEMEHERLLPSDDPTIGADDCAALHLVRASDGREDPTRVVLGSLRDFGVHHLQLDECISNRLLAANEVARADDCDEKNALTPRIDFGCIVS